MSVNKLEVIVEKIWHHASTRTADEFSKRNNFLEECLENSYCSGGTGAK